ncbi:kielin/chordin-like protein [Maniola hyperantus]|uniref:kielin/chordin-like protein n=1 Tax=Aphantopus hyperantus TaxID=2795564 RepID=UPI003748CC2E
MRWVAVVSFFVCFATLSRGSAPSCAPGSEDARCLSENTEKVPNSTESTSIVRERKKEGWAECLAGSEWESKCHKCRCSEDGHAECTRVEVCSKNDYGEPIRCKPRTSFKVDCNTCSCGENGRTACTLIGCLSGLPLLPTTSDLPALPDLPASSESPVGGELPARPDLSPLPELPALRNLTATPDLPAGPELPALRDSSARPDLPARPESPALRELQSLRDLLALRELPALPDLPALPAPNTTQSPWTGKKKDCLPGSRWKSRCNECFCTEDGLPACTEMACAEREEEPERSCAPGSRWMNDCNDCWCDSGYAACTRMGWNIAIVTNFKPIDGHSSSEQAQPQNVIRSAPNEKGVVCTANRMFIKDCNTCWCNEDGTSYFCTRKVCITELPDEIVEEQPENLQELKRKCRPDEVFEMDCNMCRCNPDGLGFSCTRRACVPEEKAKNLEETKRKCKPDEVFKMGCNLCRCNSDGSGSSCTRRACMPEEKAKHLRVNRKIRATAQGTPKTCQPGTEFRMDCNKCLCDNEGQDYSCTRIDCAALNSNGNGAVRRKRATAQVKTQCVPESVFNQDCNVCRCEADGNHATCSIKRCKEDNPDEDLDEDSPDSDLSFRCNPGEQFKRGCNDCTCSADGKSVFCTIRLCDQDITPTI